MTDAPTQTGETLAGESSPTSTRALSPAVVIVAVCLLAVAVLFRFVWLDAIPGINGDEAQAAVEVQKFLAGQPHTFRTPTGQYFNPIMIASEIVTLKLHEPSFFWLRLPSAIWICVSLVINFFLYRRVFGDRGQALLSTVLLACLPLTIAYSRIGWDSTYTLLTSPLVMYPAMLLAEHRAKIVDLIVLAIGMFLSLWVHATTGIFVVSLAAGVFWTGRAKWTDILSRRTGLPDRGWLFPVATIVLVLAGAGLYLLLCKIVNIPPGRALGVMANSTMKFLQNPPWIAEYLNVVGKIVSGHAVFRYYAAVPDLPVLRVISVVTSLAMLVLIGRLLFSPRGADRLIGVVGCLAAVMLIATMPMLTLYQTSHERYLMWIAPLFVVMLVRGLVNFKLQPPAVGWSVVAISAAMLLQTWLFYFSPLIRQTYADQLERAFLTSDVDPKSVAADVIRAEAGQAKDVRVYAVDWWAQHPIQYLLGLDFVVTREELPRADALPPGKFFVVAFGREPFVRQSAEQVVAAGRTFRGHEIPAVDGRVVMTVLTVEPAAK